MKCIVHYPGYKDYSNIKSLTQKCTERILKAKEVRESIGGDHSHAAQCSTIPDVKVNTEFI